MSIWPKRPLAQANLYTVLVDSHSAACRNKGEKTHQERLQLLSSKVLTDSWIRPSPLVAPRSMSRLLMISSSSSLVMMRMMTPMGQAMPGPRWGPPVELMTGPVLKYGLERLRTYSRVRW